jgi:hypothetical protein
METDKCVLIQEESYAYVNRDTCGLDIKQIIIIAYICLLLSDKLLTMVVRSYIWSQNFSFSPVHGYSTFYYLWIIRKLLLISSSFENNWTTDSIIFAFSQNSVAFYY